MDVVGDRVVILEKAVAVMEKAVSIMEVAVSDHEKRIRSLEQVAWKVAGAALVGSMIGGAVFAFIIERMIG